MKYRGNWKLAYDNSADGYHVVFSHRSLLDMENRLEEDPGKGMSYYRSKPDDAPMYVQYLGHGHHFKDKRPNVAKGPGALWAIEGPHPGMEYFEEKLRRTPRRPAPTRCSTSPPPSRSTSTSSRIC